MTPERKAELRALAGPSEEQWLELLDALDAAERRAEEAETKLARVWSSDTCEDCGSSNQLRTCMDCVKRTLEKRYLPVKERAKAAEAALEVARNALERIVMRTDVQGESEVERSTDVLIAEVTLAKLPPRRMP